MFDENKNTLISTANKNSANQNTDYKIDDVPIYTMAEDLAEIENPSKKIDVSPEQPEPVQKQPMIESLNEKQKTSPFLNPSAANPLVSRAENNALMDKTDEIRREALRRMAQNTRPGLGRMLAIGAVVVIILLVAAGIYYFWLTRNKNSQVAIDVPAIVVEQPDQTEPVPLIEPQPDQTAIFSTDKPNYLNLNIDAAQAADIQKTIKDYRDKVLTSELTAPVEFIVSDSNNNPIAFSRFVEKLGLAIPQNILSLLSDTFSLFIYDDNSTPGFGISIDSKNDTALKSALLKEESKLPAELQSILALATEKTYTIKNTAFTAASHNEVALRYLNITTPDELSIDYTVNNKKFTIGTTKTTFWKVLDYISRKTATGQTGNSAANLGN